MYEFDAVSVSTYEAASLAAKLTEKSADGWEVVAVVAAGSDVTAYLKKQSSDVASTSRTADSSATAVAPVVATEAGATSTAGTTSEPAGWGSAPAAAATTPAASTPAASTSSWGSGASTTDTSSGARSSNAASTPAQQPASTPSVPAGWYHDPAGRFELRYWDGSAWTEHVSRAGQQYTDPPVA